MYCIITSSALRMCLEAGELSLAFDFKLAHLFKSFEVCH